MKRTNKKFDCLLNNHGSCNPLFAVSLFGFFLISLFQKAFALNYFSSSGGICYTEVCNGTATLLSNQMRLYTHPCSNFYHYACGAYNNFRIPQELGQLMNYDVLEDKIGAQLERSLNANISNNDKKPLRLLKNVYQSCMNTFKIELDQTKIKNKIIEDIRLSGGWPMLTGDSWNETNFDWLNMTLKLQELGYLEDTFFSTALTIVGNHMKIMPSENPVLSYEDNFHFSSYTELVTATAKLLGADNETRLSEEMVQVENFMKELEKAKQNGVSDHYWITISRLEHQFLGIEYVKAQIPVPDTFSKIKEILFVNLEYVNKLQMLISKTSKRTVANYIVSKVIYNMKKFLSIEVMGPRWKMCIKEVRDHLPIAFSSVYIQEHYDREHHPFNDVYDMVSHLRDTFFNLILKSTWINDRYKSHLFVKLNNMKINIGYPVELLNNTRIEEYYKNLELSDSYFENGLKIRNFERYEKMINLEQPADSNNWIEFGKVAMDVFGTKYSIESNTLYVPAAIMQDLYFNKGLPKYMNYGALGWDISRELARSFNPDGICYNERNLKINSKDNIFNSMPGYKKIADSITALYSSYSIKERLTINGTNTLDENFADIFGLRAAYNAYEKVSMFDQEQRLSGIDRSPRQMFWLSFAGAHCSKVRDRFVRDLIAHGTKSPMNARILMPLKLIPEFGRDYQCSPECRMNNMNDEHTNTIRNAFFFD